VSQSVEPSRDISAGERWAGGDNPKGGAWWQLGGHWPAVVAFIGLAVVWEAGVRLSGTPAYILPTPSAILARTWTDLPYLLSQAADTLGEALVGLLLASLLGLTAALAMAHSRSVERAFFPLMVALKVTPMVVIAPLLILWLGFGPAPKVIVAALLSFFPILSNALIGLRSVNPRALEFMRSLNASRWEILRELRLPQSLPYLLSAYKTSATLSIIGAVVAEWVGADRGLGHVIILANSNLDMTTLLAAVLILAILGIALYVIVEAIERRALFWHESTLTSDHEQ